MVTTSLQKQPPRPRLSAFYLEIHVDPLQSGRVLTRRAVLHQVIFFFRLPGPSVASTPAPRRVMSRISPPSAPITFALKALVWFVMIV